MKTLAIELRKEKRTGVIPVLLAVGVLGAAYAFVNFIVRKDTLLNLPLAPMDVTDFPVDPATGRNLPLKYDKHRLLISLRRMLFS